MKEKYTISIADIQLNILSDEPEDYVHSTVAQLDRLIRDLTEKNRRCSKLDAALLCALDSISEKAKSDKKIKNLEAQISLYEANIRRLRQDIAQMQKAGAVKPSPAPLKEILRQDGVLKEEEPAKPKEEESAKAENTQVPLTEAAEPAAESAAPEKPEEKPALHDAKLRQIEELLRRRSEETPAGEESDEASAEVSGRDAKLREIEELLRRNGSGQTLSEALQDAIRS